MDPFLMPTIMCFDFLLNVHGGMGGVRDRLPLGAFDVLKAAGGLCPPRTSGGEGRLNDLLAHFGEWMAHGWHKDGCLDAYIHQF